MAPTTEDLFKAFLSEVRGDVSLPTPVIKHLVKYYLETAELSDVKEIRMDRFATDVSEAWLDQKGDPLPSMHEAAVAARHQGLPFQGPAQG